LPFIRPRARNQAASEQFTVDGSGARAKATRDGEYPFAAIIALDGNVIADCRTWDDAPVSRWPH
jgi:hypothetical protein